jgi:two-component system sensor histidine kinase KdpD
MLAGQAYNAGMDRLWRDFSWAVAAVLAVTLAAWPLQRITGYEAISLFYLLVVVLLALVLHRWAVLLAATLSALLWNFLFIPPLHTFRISSVQDAMMFATFFVVALVMGHITHQLRAREAAERHREARTRALNRLLQSVTASSSLTDALDCAVREMNNLFSAHTVILPGLAPSTEPDSIWLPLRTSKSQLGTLGIRFTAHKPPTLSDRQLLETLAGQIAVIIERYRLLEAAQQARVAQESERLHRTLLDSVSHELKTPLAVIRAATDGLDDATPALARTFLDEIKAANRRLERIVSNLLDMARIEAGRLPLHVEWGDVQDLLESAADQLANEVSRERLQIHVPDGLPLVRLDFGLMEQALCNLILNAVAHSPATAPIYLGAQLDGNRWLLSVTDQGSGIPPGEEQKIFEKFHRGVDAVPGGTGLGLAIVQGIARAHGGGVTGANNPAGGATFTIILPHSHEDHSDH